MLVIIVKEVHRFQLEISTSSLEINF
jgi:hypothetical protein